MARTVEPRFGVATALDAEELEGSIFCHGVNVVAYNKGAGNFVTHLDAQTLVGRYVLRNFTDKDGAGRSGNIDLVTFCVGGCCVCTGFNCPIALGCCSGCSERSGYLGAERLAVFIYDFEFFGGAYVVELTFRVALEVTGLVHADRRNLGVDSIKVGLVQGVGHQGARLEASRRLGDI